MARVFKDESLQGLPSNLHIQDSPIHGQGLFAKEDIAKDTKIGESHVFLMQDWDGKQFQRKEWLRTSIGAFLNHSDDPNCTVEGIEDSLPYGTLVATKNITAGTELTVTYDTGAMQYMGGYE